MNVLDLFCQEIHNYVVVYCLYHYHMTKHMTMDDDPGCTAKFKAASVNDFREHIAEVIIIEILDRLIATILSPQFKNCIC